ncbi:VIT1/CCC1 transporter family protein [Patescibacteria group bacterium]|jgi:VIT1/CCC1 family predicted Fe2+/Mn2+ transporter|nr:VIT1/CCC1 transporter family protein [Patescibacteria group bacterium]
MRSRKTTAGYLRNFIFGVEDSLVSTVGLLSGIAAASVPRETIILTGAILIMVEAFSMGIGSLLSESSSEEMVNKKSDEKRSAIGGAIMFISYAISGFIPLSPYMFLETSRALPISIAASLVALFALGFISARRFGVSGLKSGIRMFLLGGLAIAAGALVGEWLK